jgi:hypothetical protein
MYFFLIPSYLASLGRISSSFFVWIMNGKKGNVMNLGDSLKGTQDNKRFFATSIPTHNKRKGKIPLIIENLIFLDYRILIGH